MKELNVNELKEKYWNGTTSQEEELKLKLFLQENTQEDEALSELFSYYEQKRAVVYTKEIKNPEKKTRFFSMRNMMSIAASLTILVAAIATFNTQNAKSQEIIIDDPQVALEITQAAFALLNGEISKSSDAVKQSIQQLDKTFIFKNN